MSLGPPGPAAPKRWWDRRGNVDPLAAVMKLRAHGYYRDAQGRRVVLTIVEDEGNPATR